MKDALLISRTYGERRVALVRDGELQAFLREREGERGVVGNVYLGRVLRVLPGMQAAFVDIGLERAAFLYVGDAVTAAQRAAILAPPESDVPDEPAEPEVTPEDAPGGELEDHISARERIQRSISISDVVKNGETVLVQVTKDPIRSKGARITRQITLPGRFLVYMPDSDHIGVSRRISDPEERARLRTLFEELAEPGEGFIARTACVDRSAEELKEDVTWLREVVRHIEEEAGEREAPTCLHSDLDLGLRTLRDRMSDDIARVLVDDEEDYERVLAFARRFLPRFADRIELWEGEEGLFSAAGVDKGLGRALSRRVYLKSGAYLVIDHTEALTAIDVNTGRFVGRSSLDDTILQVNLEAARAIPEQLRLRDIGGLIVVDFIDMSDAAHRAQVDEVLLEAVSADRSRCSVLPISDFGLAQMTRHRVRDDLGRQLTTACPTCEGEGKLMSPEVVAYDVLRELGSLDGGKPGQKVVAKVGGAVKTFLEDHERRALDQLAQRLGARIQLTPTGEHDVRWSVAWVGR